MSEYDHGREIDPEKEEAGVKQMIDLLNEDPGGYFKNLRKSLKNVENIHSYKQEDGDSPGLALHTMYHSMEDEMIREIDRVLGEADLPLSTMVMMAQQANLILDIFDKTFLLGASELMKTVEEEIESGKPKNPLDEVVPEDKAAIFPDQLAVTKEMVSLTLEAVVPFFNLVLVNAHIEAIKAMEGKKEAEAFETEGEADLAKLFAAVEDGTIFEGINFNEEETTNGEA